MKSYFLDNKKPDLCLVFCGWGTDERLYLPILKDFDYLLFYDYDKELEFKIPIKINSYRNIYLLTYSAGGIMPAILQDKLPKFNMTVAVNISLKLFGKYGLSNEFIAITKGLNSSNYLDFRRNYMTEAEWEFELFNKNQPHRSFESCFTELDNLQYIAENNKDAYFQYDRVFASENDVILPYISQKEYFWSKIIKIEGAHFPFYRYNSLKYFFD